ncbi:hypothetical protein A3L04_08505 [Thermococcus chitonophagus]|uniref:Uncharacterized protein n=1 Tax=Thermococcus chitonophagus TaxID=54262 RepID=A0A160VVF0_9EURY|nr:hypothetical protein [Thermococcus chitonophagus]ASJ17106.1 hypothetical protein A3L04_08505 [Thermococcus chitonophagus]CUX77711.1 hypothetical protein CHITON_0932 [Thermococcus chitonophagus]
MAGGIKHGFRRAAAVAGTGIVGYYLITRVIPPLLGITSQMGYIVAYLVAIVSLYSLFLKMNYWSTGYLMGWIIGLYFLRGLFESWEWSIHMLISILYLAKKLKRKIFG